MDSTRSLDVVIPVYNEAPVLRALFDRLETVFSSSTLRALGLRQVRYVFVDDGSSDETGNFISDQIRAGARATLICLSRNFGHQAAVAAGLDHANADFVAIIDGDLQDPPDLLPDMIQRLDEGYDVVFGQRRGRQESAVKRAFYWGFYRICSFLSEVPMPVDAGDFCVMRREVVQALGALPERLRFQRGLRSWVGFRQSALPYDRPSRGQGVTKYTWRKLYALATDGIASLSIRPLRITQVMLFLSSLLTLGYIVAAALFFARSRRQDATSLWFLATQGLIALTSSLQLFCLYVLGAYLGRMYLEVKRRPTYVVMRTMVGPGTPGA